MKLFLTNLFLLCQFISIAQVDTNKGINFQAIARNADGSIVPSKDISIRLSIREGSAIGTIEYQEIKTTSTNVVGLFSVVLGSNSNSNITVIGDYNNINWQTGNKYLQVEIDPFNSINFILLGVQKINYVPYALVANSIDWANVKGLNTELNKKLNIQDTATMLKPYMKTGAYVKESALNGIDSFNININGSLTTSNNLNVGGNLVPTFSNSTIGTSEHPFKSLFLSSGSLSIASDTLNQNIPAAILSNVAGNLQISAGGLKLMGTNTSFIAPRLEGALTGNASTATKLETARKINGVYFDGSADITLPTSSNSTLTAGSGISINGGTISATGLTTSNLANNAAIANNQLANKTITIGSTGIDLGNTSTSLAGLTSVTSNGFTGNLNGNASTATTAGNITATTNTTLTSLANLNAVGTITTGNWSATAIDIAHGGTGTNTLNGILLGTNGSGATAIRTAAYGYFYELNDQTVIATNTPTAMYYSTTDFAEGVVIESDGTKLTRIRVANSGKYNFQFSAQLARTAGTSTESISIWLRKNGQDVPASCTDVIIHGGASLADMVAAWNFFQSLNANDYIEIMWSSTDTNLFIDYVAPRINPVRPSVPSVILSVQQVY
jgi:hypothetical protein